MSGNMDMFGDLGHGGVVLSADELVARRERIGLCPTCGQRCFEKKLFKMKPLTIPGLVSKGRCLGCNPQDPSRGEVVEAVVAAVPAPEPPGGSGGGGRRQRSERHLPSMPPQASSRRVIKIPSMRSLSSRSTAQSARSQHSLTSMGGIEEGDDEGVGSEEPPPERPPGPRARLTLRGASAAVMANNRMARGGGPGHRGSDPGSPRGGDRNAVWGDGPSGSRRGGGGSGREGSVGASGRSRGGPDRSQRSTHGSDRSRSDRHRSDRRRRLDSGQRSGGGGDGGPREPRGGNRRREESRREASPPRTGSAPSRNRESFLQRQTPRPSTVFLEGINIEELLDDFLSDDEGGGGGEGRPAPPGRDPSLRSVDTYSSASSAMRRLSAGERQALRTLNKQENSFLEIVNIMLMNSMSATVNNEGLHALSLVHDPRPELLRECADSCGFEVIVSAMGKCGKDAMAQTNACKVLFIASASGEELQLAIGNAGGIEALVDAMKEFDDDVIVLEGCLLALSNLCIPQENLDYALDTEMIELVVNGMSKNVENCGLQEHGCAVMANLAAHDGAARSRIREGGGCDTVVVSMVVNPMDVGVQSQALVTLRNLCIGDEENKEQLANAGAIDVVIQAMQNHRDDPTIQARASWVLALIGTNEDNKLYMGENGGPEAVIRSMWLFPDDVLVQEKGCRALWTMSVHASNRYHIVDVEAIPAIVAAMQNHASEPSIQERGCGVLCNLAANDSELKIRIVKDGALDVTVMAMVLHGENDSIQERAVALLHKLCIPENIDAMVSANVSPMMTVVMENNPTQHECQAKASFVLAQLT